jgi:transposase
MRRRLLHLLRQLQRMQFGRKSEKLDLDQFALALEDVEQAIASREAVADKQSKTAAAARAEKGRANRGALHAHLPRVYATIEPEDRDCPCCRSPMHAIGAQTSERLDVIPAQYRVIVTRRPKYACRACEQAVVQAPAPERLIKGGLPTEAMVASVLVSKYAWHFPLYRQAQMLTAQGIDIKRSVLAFWVGYAAAEFNPVYERLRKLILTSGKIAVDETKAPVLDPGRGRVKEGLFLGGRPRRSPMEREGSAGHRLRLCAGPRRGPCSEAARCLSGRRPVRRVCGLQDHSRQGAGRQDRARLLLGAP